MITDNTQEHGKGVQRVYDGHCSDNDIALPPDAHQHNCVEHGRDGENGELDALGHTCTVRAIFVVAGVYETCACHSDGHTCDHHDCVGEDEAGENVLYQSKASGSHFYWDVISKRLPRFIDGDNTLHPHEHEDVPLPIDRRQDFSKRRKRITESTRIK